VGFLDFTCIQASQCIAMKPSRKNELLDWDRSSYSGHVQTCEGDQRTIIKVSSPLLGRSLPLVNAPLARLPA
jgi:hypothetical protein